MVFKMCGNTARNIQSMCMNGGRYEYVLEEEKMKRKKKTNRWF